MTSTLTDWQRQSSAKAALTWLGLGLGLLTSDSFASNDPKERDLMQHSSYAQAPDARLTKQQAAIIPIAAYGAMGDMPKLEKALAAGLDAGLAISEIKEVIIQLYAYAGFPRSLNAMGKFMEVVDQRRKQGRSDPLGEEPRNPALEGEALLAAGTATQTKLVGATVEGPLFEFAPTMNTYLRTHLFGDIFNRENLGWQNRELATLGMLAGLTGVASQLKAHIGIARNTGVSDAQFASIGTVLAESVDEPSANRFREALSQ